MGDKSPHDAHHALKKSSKAIKAKRAERKSKEQATPSHGVQLSQLMQQRKHGG